MEQTWKILGDAIEFLQDATTKSPEKLEETLVAALTAIQGELEDIKQDIRDLAP